MRGASGPGVRLSGRNTPSARIPPLAKKGVGYGQPKPLRGRSVTVHRQKGGEIAAIDIGTDGQRGTVGEREGSEPYCGTGDLPTPGCSSLSDISRAPENHPPEAGTGVSGNGGG